MRAVSAEFSAAQIAQVSEPDHKVLAILPNFAASSEGSSASAGSTFSADFPASGAIDGDATHINFGPAATADNGFGLSGWKSDSGASTIAKTTAADFTAATKARVAVVDDAVEIVPVAIGYRQDFQTLTPASPLAGQDSWTDVSGAGTITVETGIGYKSSQAVRLFTTVNQSRIITRGVSFNGGRNDISWRMRVLQKGAIAGNDFSEVRFSTAGGTTRFSIGWGGFSIDTWSFFNGTLRRFFQKVPPPPVLSQWYKFEVTISGLGAGNTVKVFLDGLQVHEEVLDTTGLSDVRFVVSGSSGADTESHIDEWSNGSNLNVDGTLENVFDFGSAPTSGRAQITLNGESLAIERNVSGAFNHLGAGGLNFRDVAAHTALAQTFTPTENISADGVYLSLESVLTPSGGFWCEIRETSAGVPTSVILARGKSRFSNSVPTSSVRMDFPVPFVLKSGVVYALVFQGDFPINGTNFMRVGIDTLGPAYAGGAPFQFNGAIWSATGGADFGFYFVTNYQEETGANLANQNANLELNSTASIFYLAQGFKVPLNLESKHIWLYLRKKAGAVIPASSFWAEIQTDDGAGKPSNVALATSVKYRADSISWTAYQMFGFRIPDSLLLIAGTQYHLVLKADYATSTVNCLEIGVANGASVYPDGQRTVSTNATIPVWTGTSDSDLIFSIRGVIRPYVDLEIAYSTDNISYTAYTKIWQNEKRLPNSGTFSITGELKRYWKTRATFRRFIGAWQDLPNTPRVDDITIKQVFRSSKNITVDFGQSRIVSRLEVYGHPIEGGFRNFLLEYWDGFVFQPLQGSWVDQTNFEARKRQGSATISFNASTGVFTTTGDFVGLNLRTDIVGVLTTSKIRMTIYDNIDEWARLLELRAFRIVDVSDRVTKFSISKRSDFKLRRNQAVKLNLALQNSDGYLSPLGTNGGFNSQLGAGVKFLVFTGYKTATDYLKQGVFYVDSWNEQTSAVEVQIVATDGVKNMKVKVQANYKVGFRHADIIEYLANLAGIPSTDIILGRASSVIDYFAPIEVDAYEEAQKVAEAASFSRLYFNEDGYLVFRSLGKTSGSTRADLTPGLAGVSNACNSSIFDGGFLYQCFCVANGANDDLKLCRYSPETATWTILALVSNQGPLLGSHGFNTGYLAKLDGKIIIFNPDTVQFATNIYKCNVFEYDIDSQTVVQVSRIPEFKGPNGATSLSYAEAQDGHIFYNAPFWSLEFHLFATNLLTYDSSNYLLPLGGSNVDGMVKEQNQIILLVGVPTGGGPFTVTYYIYTFDLFTGTFTNRMTVDTLTGSIPPFPSFPFMRSNGMTSDGIGNLYFIFQKFDSFSFSPFQAFFYKIAVASWTLQNLGAVQGALAGTYSNSIAYLDGTILGTISQGTVNTSQFGNLEVSTGEIFNINSPSLSAFTSRNVAAAVLNGEKYFFATVDPLRVIEIHIGENIQKQTTPQTVLSSDSGGILIGSSVESGDEADGTSLIINLVIVKSKPIVPYPVERVWQADDVPFGLFGGTVNIIELKDPTVPGSLAVSATFDQSGGATFTLSQKTQQPVLTVNTTSRGRCTSLFITGIPLKPAGALLTIQSGELKNINRYGIRKQVFENNYIYDTMTQGLIANSILQRAQKNNIRVKDLKSMALWNIELFDRINIFDEFLGLNSDCWVAGVQLDFIEQQMSLDVVRI